MAWVFTGAVSNDFFTAGNWNLGVVPNEDREILIPSGKVCNGANDYNYFYIEGTLNVDSFNPNSLVLSSGGVLNVESGRFSTANYSIFGTVNLSNEDSYVEFIEFSAGSVLNVSSNAKIQDGVSILAGATANLLGGKIIVTGDSFLTIAGTVNLRDNSSIQNGSPIVLESTGIMNLRNSFNLGAILSGAGTINYDLPSMQNITGVHGASFKFPRNWKGGVL